MARTGVNAAGAFTRSIRAAQSQPTPSGSIRAVTAARLTAPSVKVRQPHSAICHSPPATQRHLSQSARHTAPSVTVRQTHSALCHSPPVTRPTLMRLGESDKYDLG